LLLLAVPVGVTRRRRGLAGHPRQKRRRLAASVLVHRPDTNGDSQLTAHDGNALVDPARRRNVGVVAAERASAMKMRAKSWQTPRLVVSASSIGESTRVERGLSSSLVNTAAAARRSVVNGLCSRVASMPRANSIRSGVGVAKVLGARYSRGRIAGSAASVVARRDEWCIAQS
jgi:hypothetical protein